MRRPTRLGLAVAVLLVAICGAYGAFWSVVAGRLEDGVTQWAQSLQAQNLDLSWRAIRVGGFPFRFEVELSDARLLDRTPSPLGEVRTPLMTGSARPMDFPVWQVAAPNGLSATLGSADAATARLTV